MAHLDIIVPVYNEADNLPLLAERIHKTFQSDKKQYRIIVIDDHSTDKTFEVAKKLKRKYSLEVYLKKGQRGKAFSILEGAEHATSEYICMIDGDLQYPPEAIPEMLKLTPQHGVVVARRKTYDSSVIRRVGSRTLAFIFGKLLHGISVDIQSGLKIFRRSLLETLPAQEVTAWALDLPLLHTALEYGFTLSEVEIDFLPRIHGESKLSILKPTMEIGAGALKLKFKRKTPKAIAPPNGTMIGAGVIHKRGRYITHTTLSHHDTALHTFTATQRNLIVLLLCAIAFGLVANTLATAIILVGILSFIYFVDVLFNFYLIIKSLHSPPELTATEEELAQLKDKDLPIYSILCPLYREAHILPGFLEAIDKLDWPKDKLDVLLLFEEDDQESVEAVKEMDLPKYVKVVVVPHSQPKTKPKACNYGLGFAKGEYVVIFDAEDLPEPQQLKKAYFGFQQVGPHVKCLQAKLNYYNPHQNWLTRFFTAEYSLWFDVILTGLQSIQTTIPLGGTSNHFRKQDLVDLRGWDPFNVTEDCDLGVRLFKKGYKTAIIDSTTLEEANSNPKNWLRQRSRWIKGYMQTYLIHMRDPISFATSQGIHAFLFQLTVGGKLAFILINPLLWVLTIAYFALNAVVGPTIEALYPSTIFYMAVTSLIFGNFMYLYYYMIGCAKRGHWTLIKWVFLIPIYWLMVSIAAAIALYQLIVKPHYWEKTVHGLHLQKKKLEKVVEKKAEAVVPTLIAQNLEKRTTASYPGQLYGRLVGLIKKRHLYIGGLMLVGVSMLGNVLNFFFNAYLGRHLDVEEFGLLSLTSSFLYLANIPLGALGTTVNYRVGFLSGRFGPAAAWEFWRRLQKKMVLVSAVAAVVWLASTPLLMRLFHTNNPWPFILFAPVWLFGVIMSADRGLMLGELLFGSVAAVTLLEAASKVVAVVGLVEFGQTAWVYACVPISISLAFFASRLIALFKQKRAKNIESKLGFPKKFFVVSMLSGLSTMSFLSLDLVLVKHLLSPYEAGQYALVSLIGKMIFFLSTLATQFVVPLVSRDEGTNANTAKTLKYSLLATFMLTMVGFLVFGVFSGLSLPLLLGDKILAVTPYLMWYCLGMLCFSLSRVFVMFYLAKRSYSFSFVSVGLTLVQVILLWAFGTSLPAVVAAMTAVGILNLVWIGIMHLAYPVVFAIERNVADFVELFRSPSKQASEVDPSHLRILFFNWRDTKHVWGGGAEVYIHEIAKRLVTKGHKVTVFCGNDGKHPRNEVIDGIQVVRRGGFYTVYVWAIIYYLFRFRNLFDVVIDSENGIPFLSPLYVRKPIFLLIHHIHQDVFREHLSIGLAQIANFIETTIMPKLYRAVPVITVSQSSLKDILKLRMTPEEQINIIHPGIEVPKLKKIKKTKHPSMAYLGRLKPYKNLDVAIKAFAATVRIYPAATFTIAGSGEAKSSLQKLTKELGLEEKIIFKGKVSEDEKQQLFQESWLVVQPSMVEGWGITVIEANSYCTPVIASDVKGLRDSVQNQRTGLLVDPKNVQAFTAAIMYLFSNRAKRLQLSKNARIWSESFSWDKSAETFEKLVTTTLSTQTSTNYSLKSSIARPVGNL